LLAELDGYRYRLTSCVSETIHDLANNLVALKHMLKSPQDRLLEKQQLCDEINERLAHNMQHYLNIIKEKTGSLIERLEALSPLAVLSRGYSLSMLLPEGTIIRDAARLKLGDKIKTVLGKGSFIGSVEEVIKDKGKGGRLE